MDIITTLAGLLISFLFSIESEELNSFLRQKRFTEVILRPAGTSFLRDVIQQAVDKRAELGGGIIHFTPGKYCSGTILLRNNIILYIEKGAVVEGSSKYQDFRLLYERKSKKEDHNL